jgi:hypothetical protein
MDKITIPNNGSVWGLPARYSTNVTHHTERTIKRTPIGMSLISLVFN